MYIYHPKVISHYEHQNANLQKLIYRLKYVDTDI
ncbi:hypothetical protein SAMD00079811_15110 [Scytonema sp. HK-05]|nr:hypothetical protein SAMD00079811_15110 [Scytonema sp. HK-05]